MGHPAQRRRRARRWDGKSQTWAGLPVPPCAAAHAAAAAADGPLQGFLPHLAGHIPAEAGVTLHSTWGWLLPPVWSSGSAQREQGKEHGASSPVGIRGIPRAGRHSAHVALHTGAVQPAAHRPQTQERGRVKLQRGQHGAEGQLAGFEQQEVRFMFWEAVLWSGKWQHRAACSSQPGCAAPGPPLAFLRSLPWAFAAPRISSSPCWQLISINTTPFV